MSNRLSRLPFTGYDVIGYLIPGFVFILLSVESMDNKPHLLSLLKVDEITSMAGVIMILCYAISAYAVGHILAIIGANTIEVISTSIIGYPSKFMVEKCVSGLLLSLSQRTAWCNYRDRCNAGVLAISILFFPYIVGHILFDLLGLTKHWAKSLGPRVVIEFSEKFNNDFGVSRESMAPSDWFKLIEAVVFNRNSSAASRAYNYLNLYGFSRNMSCGLYIVFVEHLLRYASDSGWSFNGCIANIGSFNLKCAILAFVSSGFLYDAFIKFYRKYSSEVVMSYIFTKKE